MTPKSAERDIRGGLMLALGFIASAGSLSTDMYLPAFPDISSSLGAGPSAVQFTLTSFLIGAGLGQLAIGALSDALGRRRTLIVALIVFALCSWAAALSPSLGFLIAVRGLQGFAGAAGSVLGRAIVADLVPRARIGSAYGWYNLVAGLLLLPASLLFGEIWSGVSPFAAFAFGAACAFAGVVVLRTWVGPTGRAAD